MDETPTVMEALAPWFAQTLADIWLRTPTDEWEKMMRTFNYWADGPWPHTRDMLDMLEVEIEKRRHLLN